MLLYVIFKIEITLVQGVQRRSSSSSKKGSVMKGKRTAWQTRVPIEDVAHQPCKQRPTSPRGEGPGSEHCAWIAWDPNQKAHGGVKARQTYLLGSSCLVLAAARLGCPRAHQPRACQHRVSRRRCHCRTALSARTRPCLADAGPAAPMSPKCGLWGGL